MKYFLDPYMMNLYNANILKKGKDDMSYITKDKQYTITFERNDNPLWVDATDDENEYMNYICKINFFDIFGRLLYQLSGTVSDMFVLLDSAYSYMEYELPDVLLLGPNNITHNLTTSVVQLERYNDNNTLFIISDYNSERMLPRLTIEFDEDSLIEFFNVLYFYLLIDLDDGTLYTLSPEDG